MSYGVENKPEWERIIRERDNFVMQCPAMSKYCSDVDAFVVFMMRDTSDIRRSMKRINWGEERKELQRYGLEDGKIEEVKYEYWSKNKPKSYFQLDYESLSSHPMWKPKHLRVNFSPKQTN